MHINEYAFRCLSVSPLFSFHNGSNNITSSRRNLNADGTFFYSEDLDIYLFSSQPDQTAINNAAISDTGYLAKFVSPRLQYSTSPIVHATALSSQISTNSTFSGTVSWGAVVSTYNNGTTSVNPEQTWIAFQCSLPSGGGKCEILDSLTISNNGDNIIISNLIIQYSRIFHAGIS